MIKSLSIPNLAKAVFASVLLAAASHASAGSCFPAIEVSSNADSGPGTLRFALDNICADGTITFNASLADQTITVLSPLFANVPVTIHGLGASHLRVDGAGNTRILEVGTQGGVRIDGITFSNGAAFSVGKGPSSSDGGAIAYDGLFASGKSVGARLPFTASTLDDCVFEDNSANNGGAIYNAALLSIQTTTFTGNSADSDGGALYAPSGAAITNSSFLNSTFYNNSAGNNGAAIAITGGNMDMLYCTLTKNISDSNAGGIGDAALYISTDGNAILSSSLIAQNHDASNDDVKGKKSTKDSVSRGAPLNLNPDVRDEDSSNAISSAGFNLIGDTTGSASFVAAGDQAGTSAGPIDAMLADLDDNGGLTPTCAIAFDSPALDRGNDESFPDADQRGITRPQLNGPDIGAFELVAEPAEISVFSLPDGDIPSGDTVQTPGAEAGDTVTRTFTISNDGGTTLTISNIDVTGDFGLQGSAGSIDLSPGDSSDFTVEATSSDPGSVFGTITIDNSDDDENPYTIFIEGSFCSSHITVFNTEDNGPGSLRQAVLDICPGGLIDFDEELAGDTITFTSNEILIDKDMTIQGRTDDTITLSGNDTFRLFYVIARNVTINDLHLNHGFTERNAANREPVSQNLGRGGAIFVANENFAMAEKSGTRDFSTVFFPDTGLFLNRCTISNSFASNGGGAIFNAGVITMDSTTVVGNSTEGNGGGIYNIDSTFIVNSTFSHNAADFDGGGIFTDEG
ncbi:MAG: choice-of-anchor Q domain-containing protein, partial [Candidatus Sumerlaeota bacterium]